MINNVRAIVFNAQISNNIQNAVVFVVHKKFYIFAKIFAKLVNFWSRTNNRKNFMPVVYKFFSEMMPDKPRDACH